VPVQPLLVTAYASLEDAVQSFRWQVQVHRQVWPMLAQIEDPLGNHERVDTALCACRYEFARRRVRFYTVKEGKPCT